jgi:hypothetical protein
MGTSSAIKIINFLFYGLFLASLALYVAFVVGDSQNSEPLLIWTYILSAFAIGSTIIFAFSNIFKTKQSMITSVIVFVVTGVLVLISYTLANGVIPTNAAGEAFDISASTSRWSGAALYMLYILMGISFVSLLYTEIKGALK